MTRSFLLAAALLAAMTTEAAACHRYAIWHYPFPQRCSASNHERSKNKVASRLSTDTKRFVSEAKRFNAEEAAQAHPGPARPTLALPGLTRGDCDAGEADEPTRAHVLLRAALEAANGH